MGLPSDSIVEIQTGDIAFFQIIISLPMTFTSPGVLSSTYIIIYDIESDGKPIFS